jgi:hypothetical protein
MYSVSSPSSIDIHLTYHARSRYDYVEWHIGVGYKINSRPNSKELPNCSDILKQIRIRGADSSPRYYSKHGWNAFYTAYFDDDLGSQGKHWKKFEVKDMGLYEEGLIAVHDALLGPHSCMDEETPQTPESDALRQQRLVQTARLLLAGAGIACSIATKDSEKDNLPRGWGRELSWNLEGIPGWFCRAVRKAAGFRLERDAVEAAEHAQWVKNEMKGSYYDDEGEDEDEDDM